MTRALLEIADELRAIATTGLHFTEGEFDRERYERLLRLAARLASAAGAGSESDMDQLYREADRGYVTPKIDVRLAVFRPAPGGHRVLLVRERSDGLWCLPGGYVDIGDSPSEAAVRETAEEACVDARVTRLVGVFDNRLRPEAPPHLFHIFKLLFLGEFVDPAAEPRAGGEIDDAGFHATDALPDLSLGRTLPADVERALRAARGEDERTHFD